MEKQSHIEFHTPNILRELKKRKKSTHPHIHERKNKEEKKDEEEFRFFHSL